MTNAQTNTSAKNTAAKTSAANNNATHASSAAQDATAAASLNTTPPSDSKFNPQIYEPQMLALWHNEEIQVKLAKRNAKGEKFFFLQGPPYTSGKLHIGHAWNHSLKDAVLRFRKMKGHKVLDRAGYDMHGLPTESKTMKKLGLNSKEDIAKFGVERFSKECYDFCKTHADMMTDDLQRLGVSLDFSDPYMPISKEYTDGVWWLIKNLHEKGRLYEGDRTVYWDWAHETALAKHELEYKTVTDTSIFVRFQLKGEQSLPTYLLIWTTTPWTIPFNLAVMVNPNVEYVYAELEFCVDEKTQQYEKQVWIVAASLVGLLLPNIDGVKNGEYKILKTVRGEELAGLAYIHPFADELAAEYKKVAAQSTSGGKRKSALHTVILSAEHVDTKAGTGLVHCAPGCGPEDYEVGYRNGLPAFNNLSERGIFPESMGKFAGRCAIPDNKKFITDLRDCGAVVHTAPVEHEYPHGQRSGEPVIFRATKQWFWKIEDLKDDMIAANNETQWFPQAAYNSFARWLENLRDNSISKQRFWGTALPVWRNVNDKSADKSDYIVVGSLAELAELANIDENTIDQHKPGIDTIEFTKNGKTYRRVPDVLDVWIDAGAASWCSLYYPKRKDLFDEYFPADFICEGTDQIRGWFNLLMVSSIAAFGKSAFKKVYMHGMLTDVDGVKMSKSLGNVISPYELVDKYGADTLRYYFTKTPAGEDISFSWDEAKLNYRNLSIYYNMTNFLIELIENVGVSPKELSVTKNTATSAKHAQELGDEERYILSKVSSAVSAIDKMFETYDLENIAKTFEDALLDVSRTYIQLVRDKASQGTETEQRAVVKTLYDCIYRLLVVAHPIIPFTTEKLYQMLKERVKNDDTQYDSIFLVPWQNVVDEKVLAPRINTQLVSSFTIADSVMQGLLAAREKLNIGVRWPLSAATIVCKDKESAAAVELISSLIEQQTNIRKLNVVDTFQGVEYTIKPNYSALKELGKDTATVGQLLNGMSGTEAKAIHDELSAGKTYGFSIGNQTFQIKKEYVAFVETVPAGLAGGTWSGGQIYLSGDMSPELEAEGYAREAMRRIQSARKDAGLQKKDVCNVVITASDKLRKAILANERQIKDRCGLADLSFEVGETSPDALTRTEKIKNEELTLALWKVK